MTDVLRNQTLRRQPFNGLLSAGNRPAAPIPHVKVMASWKLIASTNIDTPTPAGRMMMQMVGTFAEFERAMIRERTSAVLAAARAEGRIGGRRKKLDAAKRREIADSVISGRKSDTEMARLYNICAPTVSPIAFAQHRTGPA